MVMRRSTTASGRVPSKRWRRVRAKRKRRTLNKIASRDTGRNCGWEMKRNRGHAGGTKPRAIVVTITEAVPLPLPLGNEAGLTEHVVAVAATGSEHDKLT